jgi:transposase
MDARRLAPAAREVLRLRVVAVLESGRVRGYRRAAEMFGVSERSVGSWWRAYQAGGREALAVRHVRRPGPWKLVSDEERASLFQAMADYTPEQLLINGPLWTRAAVAELVRMVIGVVMTERGVGKWLRRHGGLSPQRPTRRAYWQQDKEVHAWLDEQYPTIADRAKAEGATVAWADRCGLRWDAAPPGGPGHPAADARRAGQRQTAARQCNDRGRLARRVVVHRVHGRFTATVFTAFLDRLARQAGRKVHVIADRHPVHRSKRSTIRQRSRCDAARWRTG